MQISGAPKLGVNKQGTEMPKKNDWHMVESPDDFEPVIEHTIVRRVRISNNRGIFEMDIKW